MIDLTPRELEVVRLLTGGMTTGEIAFALDAPTAAVDQILAEVTVKLETANLHEAVAKAIELGLVTTEL